MTDTLTSPANSPVVNEIAASVAFLCGLVDDINDQLLAGFVQSGGDIEGADTGISTIFIRAGEGITVPENIHGLLSTGAAVQFDGIEIRFQ